MSSGELAHVMCNGCGRCFGRLCCYCRRLDWEEARHAWLGICPWRSCPAFRARSLALFASMRRTSSRRHCSSAVGGSSIIIFSSVVAASLSILHAVFAFSTPRVSSPALSALFASASCSCSGAFLGSFCLSNAPPHSKISKQAATCTPPTATSPRHRPYGHIVLPSATLSLCIAGSREPLRQCL
ncbi:hypothetical protein B0H19DRAFT_383978 [Mycena capillaripes]|nr:hypothetical protein B0H19DRAFT_383978 [Mycena capillaripes]